MPLVRNSGKAPRPTGQPVNIAAGLADVSAETRFRTAREAADHAESVPDLAQALSQERDARVREAIFSALTIIATPESIAAIVPYIRSEDASLRTGAMDALRVSRKLSAAHLQGLLSDPDSDVRLLACDLARDMDGHDPSRLLCELLDIEPHTNVCAMAIEVLAEIGDSSAIAPLARCAARFPNDPFLPFAIEAASDRLMQRQSRG